MLRVVHLADVHLDTAFTSKDQETRRRLIKSGREALRRAVDLCFAREAHALVIAGDLFDQARWSFASEKLLMEQFERLSQAGVTTVIVSGNHDPGNSMQRLKQLSWPARVHWLTEERAETFAVMAADGRSLRGKITGIGHASDRVGRNLTNEFSAPDLTLPHVAVLHTHVESATASQAHKRYAPCGFEDLKKQPYSYYALGHIHLRQRVLAQPSAHYPGNLQGRHRGESGAKGGLVVTMHSATDVPEVEFVPLARARFECFTFSNLQQLQQPSELVALLKQAMHKRQEQDPGLTDHEWFVSLKLEGRSPLALKLPRTLAARQDVLNEWEEQLITALALTSIEIDASNLHQPMDVEVLRKQPTLVGEVFRFAESLRAGAEPMTALPDLRLATVGRDDLNRNERLLQLLEGVEFDVIERLLEPRS